MNAWKRENSMIAKTVLGMTLATASLLLDAATGALAGRSNDTFVWYV
jgi:hypothetical protein